MAKRPRTLQDVIQALGSYSADDEATAIHDAASVLLAGKQETIRKLCAKERGWDVPLRVGGSPQPDRVLKEKLTSKVPGGCGEAPAEQVGCSSCHRGVLNGRRRVQ